MNYFSFFIAPPESSLLYSGFYDPVLVGLSVAVAIFASYASLLLTQSISSATSSATRHFWTAIGGLCLGGGIWAMHFVGMLAFSLPCTTSYNATVTFLSTIPGVLASTLAIRIISHPTLSSKRLVFGGLLMGIGIGAMHYAGMAAMRLDGMIRYDLWLFLLSIGVAVAMATLALWLKFWMFALPGRWRRWATPVSALVLGLAVSGMHYTAMAAAYFIQVGEPGSAVTPGLSTLFLASIVLVITSLLVVITLVASYVSRTQLATLGRAYKLITLCVLGWCAVAWLSADYYHQRRSSQYFEAEKQLAQQQAQRTASNINEYLQLLRGIARVGATGGVAQQVLGEFALQRLDLTLTDAQRQQRWTANPQLSTVNQYLFQTAAELQTDQIYLLDALGNCIAASNAGKANSFVGFNYADRDYFVQARAGQLGHQYAVGRTSKVAGLYFSGPVSAQGRFIGTVVVKIGIEKLGYFTDPVNAFVSDASGVIVLAPDKAFEFRSLPSASVAQLPAQQRLTMYGRDAFEPLNIRPWGDARLAGVVTLGANLEPVVLASTLVPEDALTVHAMRPLSELARFQLERNWLFFLLAAAGSLLMVAAWAVINYLRATQLADAELRIAATAFELQQGMTITNAEGVILRVNQAFTEITGYCAEEAVGQTPKLLRSGRHDAAFYKAMWDTLTHVGVWQGEIWNRRKNGEVFPEWLTLSSVKSAAGKVTHFVAIFSDITARKTAESQIEQLAFFDSLTLLPNRRLLLDRLGQALTACVRHQRRAALLYLDLDNFKTLNDTSGHALGDLLLMQVADRLSCSVRDGDTVARLGGDKFAVMLEDLSLDAFEAANQAEIVGEKIRLALSQVYTLDGYQYHSTPSIGITLLGDDVKDARIDEPLKRSELAMYQAKAIGRNAIRFFDPQMQEKVSARAALENDLRDAIANSQFVLHYQAQVVGDGRLTGVEALVRWQHPHRGLVSPAEFIPLAEECGLILPLGQWVLETACTQLAAWAKWPDMAHLTIAVNVSARQLHQADFVDKVQAVLNQTGANPKRLKLELTESLLVDDVQGTIGKMSTLKTQGVGFSLDDFGTGYSSLAYLKRLPLDQLKIDQGFVRNILTDSNDAAIARMVIVLAESLGLTVIAEGVELDAQRDVLARQGCHAYQGYLFSKALPIADFEAYARRGASQAPPRQRAT